MPFLAQGMQKQTWVRGGGSCSSIWVLLCWNLEWRCHTGRGIEQRRDLEEAPGLSRCAIGRHKTSSSRAGMDMGSKNTSVQREAGGS